MVGQCDELWGVSKEKCVLTCVQDCKCTGFDYGFDASRARCRICSSTIVGTEASILDAAVCYDRTAGCLDLP
ncbi:hypothetical protein EMIHUDRAFT_215387 [Emiliania huxleyi CCMP1516]|uniref:Apple domain-containing protein n=2 Tax=Emiliania huxleyi TaxID=2903 RepID=A0A0D3IHA5_EMIH1|nr:hypothetical protein EMIHUDRAFT_215387 [Emiliania huxleyi CCMP1516]EOD10640.1 hypothetical protein EMIHUDRAFT_215387 [Emiliania huxleyi CCMP1516]|eukprot:XP_005763069.1 hypothetical protein EMIHUDRAFT_215387 [Emiliania huxleyi CCMP1516]